MQKAELVLTMLNQKSKEDKTFKFRRLYRNLYNFDFYLNAYAKIYNKEGNMTMGVDGKTIDGYGFHTIDRITEKIRYERFKPYPVKRRYIPKKNSTKLRPLGIPAIDDKLVQEVIRQILEVIYEPIFSNNSHGFRPGRSCHTALYQTKILGTGSSWVVEGDIKGFFDNIDHEILINLLRKKIDDNRFLNLITKFLKAGIMEEGQIRNSITGTPQGGIISPILANIYLNELDEYMEQLSQKYYMGKKRKINPEYRRLIGNRYNRIRKGRYKEAKEMLEKAMKMQTADPLDHNFIRVNYVRYADDFVILIIGAKSLAQEVKMEIAEFLDQKLKLELSMEKTLITNILRERARFLGYEICKAKCDTKMIKTGKGRKRRSINGSIQLLVPSKIINEKIKPFTKNGKPTPRKDRVNDPVIRIIKTYNAEIRGLYNYYSLANNMSKYISKFQYYHYYSLVKTIGNKHKLKVKKTIRKYAIPIKRKDGTGTRNIIGIKYKTKNGEKIMTYFSESLRRKIRPLNTICNIDTNPTSKYKNEIISRMLRSKCELCETEQELNNITVHHLRNLKTLKEKYENERKMKNWEKKMVKMNRRTLVVCNECHNKIHK